MTLTFASAPADRRLLAEARSGPMPWVIAIMTFLTVLAAAAGLALAGAADALGRQVSGRVTVQIVEGDRPTRDAQAAAAAAAARRLPGVVRVERLSDAALARLVEPWLGADALILPQPALIDIDLARPTLLPQLTAIVQRVAPSARIDANAAWLAPLKRLVEALRGLALSLILLTGIATAASVVLAARAALNTHGETIGVLHLLGATDLQIARLFQRRIAIEAIAGGAFGFVAGIVVLVLLGRQTQALGAGLSDAAMLGTAGWLTLPLAPIGAALLATLVARLTVERALRRIL